MMTIRERLEKLMPEVDKVWAGVGVFRSYYKKEEVLDALEKCAKVVYQNKEDNEAHWSTITFKRDTHSALLLDIQLIEPEDSIEKLVQDLATLDDPHPCLSKGAKMIGIVDRAKRLMKKD